MNKNLIRFAATVLALLAMVSVFCSCMNGNNQNTSGTSGTQGTASSTMPLGTSTTTTVETGTANTSMSTTMSETQLESTTVPIFARFDFGTKSKAEAEKRTSHEYILSALTYDAQAVSVAFTDDALILTALSDGTFDGVGDTATTADSTWFIRNTKTCYRPINTYALCFDNMVTLDFEDELKSGYGGWAGYPFSFGNIGKKDAWRGYHQYMKLRIKNPTDNNMIAVQFNNGAAFATTQFMVMSIGAGKTEYQSYIYDLCYAATYPSGKGVILAGQQPGNNWTWKQGTPVTGLRFHLLGATCSYANAYLNNVFDEGETAADYDVYYEYFKRLDSRALIKKGNSVEIDYIVFGSDPMALAEYHSNMEDSASKS